jgi:molybdenum cofactor synthesis domain-containing protein
MDAVILTVGDEILAGDIQNTNAHWLAARMTERGTTIKRILTLPDQQQPLANTISTWSERYDAVIVTGGLGATHDDTTLDAVAAAFDRDIVVDTTVRETVIQRVADHRNIDPQEVPAEIDVDAWSAVPYDARTLPNPEGLCPGFVVENTYVFPGVPAEMKATFDAVAEEFDEEFYTAVVHVTEPEANLVDPIAETQDAFDVKVGSYPDSEANNRLKVTSDEEDAVSAAVTELRRKLDVKTVEYPDVSTKTI